MALSLNDFYSLTIKKGPCNFVVAEYFNIVGGTPSQTCEEYQDQIFQEYLDSTG